MASPVVPGTRSSQLGEGQHLIWKAGPSPSALVPWLGEPGAGHCRGDPSPGPAAHPVPKPSGRPGAREVPQRLSPPPLPTPHTPKKSAKGSRPPKNSRKTS